MRRPSRAVGAVLHQVTGQAALAHAGQRRVIDDVVVGLACAQQPQQVQPAPACGRGETVEVLVADLGADAVHPGMVRAGVVDRDPGRCLKPRPQHVTSLGHEAVLASDQQPHHLALRDVDADGAQLCHQPCASVFADGTCL